MKLSLGFHLIKKNPENALTGTRDVILRKKFEVVKNCEEKFLCSVDLSNFFHKFLQALELNAIFRLEVI